MADIIQFKPANTNADTTAIAEAEILRWQRELHDLAQNSYYKTMRECDGVAEKMCDVIMMQMLYFCHQSVHFDSECINDTPLEREANILKQLHICETMMRENILKIKVDISTPEGDAS